MQGSRKNGVETLPFTLAHGDAGLCADNADFMSRVCVKSPHHLILCSQPAHLKQFTSTWNHSAHGALWKTWLLRIFPWNPIPLQFKISNLTERITCRWGSRGYKKHRHGPPWKTCQFTCFLCGFSNSAQVWDLHANKLCGIHGAEPDLTRKETFEFVYQQNRAYIYLPAILPF